MNSKEREKLSLIAPKNYVIYWTSRNLYFSARNKQISSWTWGSKENATLFTQQQANKMNKEKYFWGTEVIKI